MLSKTIIGFLAVFIGGCLLALFSDPFWGILVYVFVYFLNPPARWWWGGSGMPEYRFIFTVTAVTLISFLIRLNKFKGNRFGDLPQVKWLVGMSIIVIAAKLWAVSPEAHSILMEKYFKVLIFSLLIFKLIDTPNKMEALLSVYMLGSFYVSWIGWQQGRTGYGRLEGIGGADTTEGNSTAAVIVTAIPLLVFYTLFGKKRWVQFSALVGLAFVMNCLILINSRGAFLALVFIGLYLVYHIVKQNKDRQVKIKAIAGIATCAILFIYLTDVTFLERMNFLLESNPNEVSRVEYWLKTFDMLKDHPLGLGAWGYNLLSSKYLPPEWLTGGQRAVHSLWFEVLAEYGYQGLIIFVGFIYATFSFMNKVRQYLLSRNDMYLFFQSTALQASFLSLLVCCTFVDFFYVEVLYWIPMIMGAFANIYMLKPQQNVSGAEMQRYS
jgi:O-antigen ligase